MASFELTHGGARYQVDAPDEATAIAAFTKVMGGAAQAPGRDKGILGTIDAGVRGVADTLTFGLMDEAAAGLGAITGIGGKFGDYEGNLAKQQGYDKFDEENNFGMRLGGQVIGGIGSGVGLARAGLLATPRLAGASKLVRYPVAAAEGAALGGAYGAGSTPGGVEDRAAGALSAVPAGAAFGVAGEVAAPLISRGASAVADRVRSAVSAATDLGPARSALAQTLGIDPAQIPDALAADYARQAQRAVDPAAAARQTAAGEFGIPLTRGQATGDMDRLGFEEAARNQARGQLAGTTLRSFDDRQREAITQARTRIAETIDQGRPVTTTSQGELAQDVLDGVRQAEARSAQGVNEAYDAARATPAVVRADAVQGAGGRIREGLEADGFVINPAMNPYATRALQEVDNMVNLQGALANRVAPLQEGQDVVGVTLTGIEQVRKRLGQFYKNASPEDARAVSGVRRAFDAWLDETADRGLLEGTPEALDMFRAARAARAQHGRNFESNPRQADADAGRVMEKLIDTDVTPTEVANYLLGSAKAGERGLSVRLAARLRQILPQDSPEWGALKQATWFRLTTHTADNLPAPGPEAVARRIQEFVSGKGEPFARTMFSPAEIGLMRRFAGALQQTVTPRNVRNPSGSGYEAARALAEGAKSVASLLGGTAAGPAGAMGARISAGLLAEGRGFLRARRAVSPVPRLPYDPQTRAAVSGAAAGFGAGQSGEGLSFTVPPRLPYIQ